MQGMLSRTYTHLCRCTHSFCNWGNCLDVMYSQAFCYYTLLDCSVHLCVTLVHTKPGIADRFINDIKEAVTEIMKTPDADCSGQVNDALNTQLHWLHILLQTLI